jgi:hypothetical protein
MTKHTTQLPDFYENLGTPLIPDDMPAEVDPAELTIPTRAELAEREAKEDKGDDTTADGAGKGSGDNDGGNGSGVSGKGAEDPDKSSKDSDKPEDQEDTEAVLAGAEDREPVYQTTLEDPGEFTPTDRSFEVMIYDQDGKNGKPVKITSVEQFEQLLDEDKNFGSAAALLKAQRLAGKMELGLEREKADHDHKKALYDEQQEAVKANNDWLNQRQAEMTYLVSKGELPAVPKKYANADWSDPEVAKQPGVKEHIALMKYFKEENAARAKAGLAPFSGLIDAFNQYDRDQARKALRETGDKSLEARRAASSRVAATTPAPVSAAPKGVMVGRNLGSLSNLSDML